MLGLHHILVTLSLNQTADLIRIETYNLKEHKREGSRTKLEPTNQDNAERGDPTETKELVTLQDVLVNPFGEIQDHALQLQTLH